MTLVVETSSLTKDRRTKFVEALEPMFELSETPIDEAENTMFTLARRDGKEMTVKDGRDTTLAAFGAGLKVLRAE